VGKGSFGTTKHKFIKIRCFGRKNTVFTLFTTVYCFYSYSLKFVLEFPENKYLLIYITAADADDNTGGTEKENLDF
jgi:hypothetical protein